MQLHFPAYRFFTSAIVGGILPIACGVAAAGARVWCFVGDMTASIGAFADAHKYACLNGLPITFVIEDNHLSTNTYTNDAWGGFSTDQRPISKTRHYFYQRTYPHVGSGKYVAF